MKRMLLLALLLPLNAFADDEYSLVIENHQFSPNEISIPAGKKIRLNIENRDATPEEFDSHALNREKVLMGNSTGLVFIGPLEPGEYPFMGEFHADTAQGKVVAK
jgi:Cupredoxin-like domain